MKKRLLALLLVVCIVATLVPTAFATGYSDVDGHWAEDAIARWSAYGIVEGNNGKFEPGEELTRGQLAAIIARLLKLPAAESAGFKDTDGHWAEDVINRCAAAGIMLGDGVNARPGDAVSREETMVLLARALGIKPVENVDMSDYKDAKKVSSWAEGYVAAMTDKGIVNGIDGSLQPASDINRASAMTILHNAISTYANVDGQTVAGTGEGIVLVAAKNVTVTGEADGIVVSAGAEGGQTNITAAKVESVTVQAADADVNINSSEVKDVAVEAPQAEVTLTNTKTENVEVSEKAEDAKVEVGTGSTVTNVENKADGTTVSGSGTVSNVTTSGDNTKVETGGTKVEAAPGTTGTTAGGQTVTGGGTATTTPTTPSTPSTPTVHIHYYADYKANGDGTHTGTCACKVTETTACEDGSDADTKCDKCGDDTAAYVATVGGKKYKTLADAVAVGGTVTLLKDVDVTAIKGIQVTKNTTIALNNKTLKSDVEYVSGLTGTDISAITVDNGATLTISGGKIVAATYGIYAKNGTVNVSDIEIVAGTTTVQVANGTANIAGGKFSVTEGNKRYVVNCIDANWGNGTAKVNITGGTFADFNPADNLAESGGANFVAPGYKVTKTEGKEEWTVEKLFAKGTGTQADPFIISTAADMMKISEATGYCWYKVADGVEEIDFANEDPLISICGNFNGNGVTFKGIKQGGQLFDTVYGNAEKTKGEGKAIIENFDVVYDRAYGGVVYYNTAKNFTLKNVNVIGSIEGTFNHGSFIDYAGTNNDTETHIVIEGCSSDVTVIMSGGAAAGFIGHPYCSADSTITIKNSKFTGELYSSEGVDKCYVYTACWYNGSATVDGISADLNSIKYDTEKSHAITVKNETLPEKYITFSTAKVEGCVKAEAALIIGPNGNGTTYTGGYYCGEYIIEELATTGDTLTTSEIKYFDLYSNADGVTKTGVSENGKEFHVVNTNYNKEIGGASVRLVQYDENNNILTINVWTFTSPFGA